MMKPNLLDSFVYAGKDIKVEWFEVASIDDLPDVPWQQVYAICNLNGKVPVVLYENARTNLPGGHTEAGESIEETLNRELDEELNCRVKYWYPIGYQKLTEPDDPTPVYQLRVYAEVEKIGEFTEDTGGSVIGHKLVNLKDLNGEIGYGKVGERIVAILEPKFGDIY